MIPEVRFKEGISLKGLQPQTVLGIQVAAGVFARFGLVLTITSLNDGEHMDGSKHYDGLAFDCRTWDPEADPEWTQLSEEVKWDMRNALSQALGPEYDVLVKPTHIHVEYDA